jgi:hypothetical protein
MILSYIFGYAPYYFRFFRNYTSISFSCFEIELNYKLYFFDILLDFSWVFILKEISYFFTKQGLLFCGVKLSFSEIIGINLSVKRDYEGKIIMFFLFISFSFISYFSLFSIIWMSSLFFYNFDRLKLSYLSLVILYRLLLKRFERLATL